MNALPDSIPARGAAASASRSPRIRQLVRQSFAALTARERARLIAMYGVIAGLHVAGFVILFMFVVPSHYKGLGVGVAVLAYTLGLRHAFDADHISAIDNCTRKVLGERQGTGAPRPLGFGFFFSLGHSTVVVPRGRDRCGADVFAGDPDSLGEGFAWTETVLVLSAIAARWDLRLADGASVHPVTSSTLVANELPIVVTRRFPA